MIRTLSVLLCGAVALCSVFVGAQEATRSGAAFRARRDLQLLDVTVTAGRDPVRGLTAADFTVRVDGRPAAVAGVQEIAVRPPTPASIAERSLLPDVVSNQLDTKRVVVVFIDDFSLLVSGEVSAGTIEQTRDIARRVVNGLGPDDLSAVLFSFNDRRTQTLTTRTPLLLDAIDRAALFTVSPEALGGATNEALAHRGDCYCGLCSCTALRQVAESLRSLAGVRKTIVYVGSGMMQTVPPDPVCYPQQVRALEQAFDAAKLANITIDAFDPRGLKPMRARGFINPDLVVNKSFIEERFDPRLDFLRNLASTTGGRAVINTNEPGEQVDDVLEAGRSYYVVGVTLPEAGRDSKPGRTPKIEVRVTRRGTKTSVRAGYRPPGLKTERAAGSGTPGTEPLEALTAALLPDAEVPMEVTASPFAGPDGQPVVSVVLGVLAGRGIQAAGQPVDVLVRVLDHRGQEVTTHRERAAMPAAAAGERYAFQSVIPLPPGRYELRAAARSEAFGQGSVYTHVDVPDFRGGRMSATNLILTTAGGTETTGGSTPVQPLTRRSFGRADRVAAFLRVYQVSPEGAPLPDAAVRLLDSAGTAVVESSMVPSGAVAWPAAGGGRAIDYGFPLPLEGLLAGEYRLTVQVTTTPGLERTLGFRVE